MKTLPVSLGLGLVADAPERHRGGDGVERRLGDSDLDHDRFRPAIGTTLALALPSRKRSKSGHGTIPASPLNRASFPTGWNGASLMKGGGQRRF
jgi:hypothetical protein